MLNSMRRAGALAAMVFLVGACAGPSLRAVSDFDTDYDFSAIRRIAILPIDRTSAAEKLISDMQVSRINGALAAELATQGYRVVEEREDADAYLSWHLVTHEQTDIRSYNASSLYNCWRCGPPTSDVSVRQFTEGTFIVDIIDPLRNRSVWRSTIQSRLKARPDQGEAERRRAAAAEAVLAPFPPQPSSGRDA